MLKQVERGEISADAFMDGIADMTGEFVKAHTEPDEQFPPLFPRKDNESDTVGTCPPPRIGGPRKAKGLLLREQGLRLALGKTTGFSAKKKKTVTKSIAAALLKEGRVFVSGLYSEKPARPMTRWWCWMIMDKYVNFKLEFSDKLGARNEPRHVFFLRGLSLYPRSAF